MAIYLKINKILQTKPFRVRDRSRLPK